MLIGVRKEARFSPLCRVRIAFITEETPSMLNCQMSEAFSVVVQVEAIGKVDEDEFARLKILFEFDVEVSGIIPFNVMPAVVAPFQLHHGKTSVRTEATIQNFVPAEIDCDPTNLATLEDHEPLRESGVKVDKIVFG